MPLSGLEKVNSEQMVEVQLGSLDVHSLALPVSLQSLGQL